MFKDEVLIHLRSGKGGDGAVSFRREKFIPKGGPDGGDGGKGGDVVFQGEPGLTSLGAYHNNQKFHACDGRPGGGSRCTGKSGEDLLLKVPLGTVIKDAARGNILRDLADSTDPFVFLTGGRGGRGNARMATSVDQVPRRAEEGKPGSERSVVLEVKMIADIGILGLPNAGKSTFLARVTRASPQIADYPFTTLIPQLGVAELHYHRVVFADIPGLIEGAHKGLGLGHKFLRHLERTRVLLHLIDCDAGRKAGFGLLYSTIQNELRNYSAVLASKPLLVGLSKADLAVEPLDTAAISEEIGKPVFLFSSHTGQGLKSLLYGLLNALGLSP